MPFVRVIEVVKETAEAHTLVLVPIDDTDLTYRPGQFLTVRIPTDLPGGAARCYSLCTAPAHDEHLAVTVKRTREGYASNWLCDHVGVGSELEVLRPSGLFTPASLDEDLLLLAGGSGITPMMSILTSVLRSGTGSLRLVYANRDESSVIFAQQLVDLVAEFPERLVVVHWLESVQGLPTAPELGRLVGDPAGRASYVCGPAPFMELVGTMLADKGVAPDRVHVERFTSLRGDPFADVEVEVDTSGPVSEVEVTLDGQTRTLAWPASNKLLDVLLAAGIEAPFSCREGSCSACACILLEGEVEHEHNEVLDAGDLAEGIRLGCQALPRSPRIRISYDD